MNIQLRPTMHSDSYNWTVRFQIFTAASIKMAAFWDDVPCTENLVSKVHSAPIIKAI
jgi:hypothetical protein